ncbi:transketolase [Paraburkholderia dipogonis]|uniref:Transketolase n=1 Tax=Paraburkholderia dipogonis TaxID=1211383 RepID=A0A4Y8MH82_9BURK|nr:transketolase [Paraburkholderia dipogonis]TFE36817.1 transketolase [Paraburkholderia dipogonis]
MCAATNQSMANAIRFLAIDSILKAGEGHQGVPLGMAEIATSLFTTQLKFSASNPKWPDRDRFVLSNGHGSLLLYSLLYLTGYSKISIDELKTFRELGSHCPGHPEFDPSSGVEATTGPLGQGIANALGMAIAEAYLRARFGSGIIDHYTYAFVGDGCLQEGVGQEMISLAGHLKLGKLILCWDDNRITDDGSTALSISENVSERFRVAGWHVVEVDGHDVDSVSAALAAARVDPRPSMIACRTKIGKGLARLEGTRGGHSGKLFESDAVQAREALDWPHAAFEVPDAILQKWRDAGQRGDAAVAAWEQRLQKLAQAEREEFERFQSGTLKQGWQEIIQEFKKAAADRAEPTPTIAASGDLSDLLGEVMPERLVACADLEAPTNHKRSLKAFTAEDISGAYVHCGVREHVMGSLANGMLAHGGVTALSVTYLAFSDYQRPAMRMAALMGLPVKFVFSHDSIGVGKNGPTHQPVEIVASLRAMPNMLVFRPADSTEVAECWELAHEATDAPSSMIFARQAVPRIRMQYTPENLSSKGAYILSEPKDGQRHVTLMATGSEVQIAVEASKLLEVEGIKCAVVSMPCFELFEKQDLEYRKSVLGNGLRVGIEAAVRQGWDRYLGDEGIFVGMTGFGDSGPAEELFKLFGITASRVVEDVKARLR